MSTAFYFIFILFVNAIIAFFMAYMMIELFLKIFRVRSLLWRYLFRTLPYLKLIIDPFLYRFSNWSVFESLKLFSLGTGGKLLQLGAGAALTRGCFYYLRFDVPSKKLGFTCFDILVEKYNITFFHLVGIVLVIIIILRIACKLSEYIKMAKPCQHTTNFDLSILPLSQQQDLLRKKIRVELSEHSDCSPCVRIYPKKIIILPKNITEILNTSEIAAVIAHEIGHCQPLFICSYLLFDITKTIFLLPSFKKIKLTLEQICDAQIMRYQIPVHFLMNAIYKFAKMNYQKKITFPSFINYSSTLDRIKSLETLGFVKHTKIKAIALTTLLLFFTCLILSSTINHF